MISWLGIDTLYIILHSMHLSQWVHTICLRSECLNVFFGYVSSLMEIILECCIWVSKSCTNFLIKFQDENVMPFIYWNNICRLYSISLFLTNINVRLVISSTCAFTIHIQNIVVVEYWAHSYIVSVIPDCVMCTLALYIFGYTRHQSRKRHLGQRKK